MLSIVLVSWNSKEYLVPCLESIYSANLMTQFEVIVVDNCSTDGTPDVVRSRFPLARVLEGGTNVGFAGGNNRGVSAARGQFVLLLNPDTLVEGRSIDAMVRFMEENADAGAVGAKLLNRDGSFQAGYANFSGLVQEFLTALNLGERIWPGYPVHRRCDQPKCVDWVCAACLLIRKSVYVSLGGLDEEYFMYSEEVDFLYRLKQSGMRTYYLPESSTIHYGGGSQDRWRRRQMVYRGKILFYKKNYGPIRLCALRAMLAGLTLAKLVVWYVVRVFRIRPAYSEKEILSNRQVLILCVKPT